MATIFPLLTLLCICASLYHFIWILFAARDYAFREDFVVTPAPAIVFFRRRVASLLRIYILVWPPLITVAILGFASMTPSIEGYRTLLDVFAALFTVVAVLAVPLTVTLAALVYLLPGATSRGPLLFAGLLIFIGLVAIYGGFLFALGGGPSVALLILCLLVTFTGAAILVYLAFKLLPEKLE